MQKKNAKIYIPTDGQGVVITIDGVLVPDME